MRAKIDDGREGTGEVYVHQFTTILLEKDKDGKPVVAHFAFVIDKRSRKLEIVPAEVLIDIER